MISLPVGCRTWPGQPQAAGVVGRGSHITEVVEQGIAEVTECAYRIWPRKRESDVQAARRATPDLTLSIGLEATHLSPSAET